MIFVQSDNVFPLAQYQYNKRKLHLWGGVHVFVAQVEEEEDTERTRCAAQFSFVKMRVRGVRHHPSCSFGPHEMKFPKAKAETDMQLSLRVRLSSLFPPAPPPRNISTYEFLASRAASEREQRTRHERASGAGVE